MPPPDRAEFPLIVLLVTVSVFPALLQMPPPLAPAELPLIVVLITVSVAELPTLEDTWIPPPPC